MLRSWTEVFIFSSLWTNGGFYYSFVFFFILYFTTFWQKYLSLPWQNSLLIFLFYFCYYDFSSFCKTCIYIFNTFIFWTIQTFLIPNLIWHQSIFFSKCMNIFVDENTFYSWIFLLQYNYILVLSPITITYPNMDASEHILVSRYIYIVGVRC
jgi:hypothetical protein